MDIEMVAPRAAAAIATVIKEPERRSSMVISFDFFTVLACRPLLLQRIERTTTRCVVLRQRIGPAPLGKLTVFQARRLEYRGMAEVPFEAARLVINPVFLLILSGELLRDSPRTRPYSRIVDSHEVFQRVWTSPRPSL